MTNRQIFEKLQTEITPAATADFDRRLLAWDGYVNGQSSAAEARAKILTHKSLAAHQAFIQPHIGRAISLLLAETAGEFTPMEQRWIWRMEKAFDRESLVTSELLAEQTKANAAAKEPIKRARADQSFVEYAPFLQTQVECARIEAQRRGARMDNSESVYSTLAENYYSGFDYGRLMAHLAEIQEWSRSFLPRLRLRPVSTSAPIINEPMSKDRQKEILSTLWPHLGQDPEWGRLFFGEGSSTYLINPKDVRSVIRLRPPEWLVSLSTMFHEAGHVNTDQGQPPLLDWTLVESVRAMGLAAHETQAAIWQYHVGRSHEAWVALYPKLQEMESAFLGIPLDLWYRKINDLSLGMSNGRTNEATYPLHLGWRIELEKMLLGGEISVADIPIHARRLAKKYLGYEPTTDPALLVIDDGMWLAGMFGLYPNYVVGPLGGAQLVSTFKGQHPIWTDDFRQGNFGPLRKWMAHYVHQHVYLRDLDDILFEATGSSLSPKDWMEHIEQKFIPLYT